MMSMDAVLNRGFKLANYCDTTGNPPASKVYRAARIILSQPGIRGYFASGSGVASQEQYHSARGLVKAFREENLAVPAVLRLGGNFEEKAIEILQRYLKQTSRRRSKATAGTTNRNSAPHDWRSWWPETQAVPPAPAGAGRRSSPDAYAFATLTGELAIDHAKCPACRSKGCVEASHPGILKLDDGLPVLAIRPRTRGGQMHRVPGL